MASKTEICNLALGHLGVGKEIANLDTEKSNEAAACRRFYETSKDAVLRDFPWGFATKERDLSLIGSDPTTEWKYSYRYPSDCLRLRRIYSGDRTDTNDTRVSYKVTRDDVGLLIYTDQESATAEYTLRADDPGQYPADFTMSLSWRLASYIAPSVTAGDPFKLREQALQMYVLELSKAESNAENEEQNDKERRSEMERVRD